MIFCFEIRKKIKKGEEEGRKEKGETKQKENMVRGNSKIFIRSGVGLKKDLTTPF